MASCERCVGVPSILSVATIQVRESWDPKEGVIEPKTRTSQRATPIPGVLWDLLLAHRKQRGEPPEDALVFGVGNQPFHAASLYRCADAAWEATGLPDRLRLHQARHAYASFMIAAGANAKALSAFMGHSSIKVTFDLYGHLMLGTAAEAAALLDSFLGADIGEAPSRRKAPIWWPKWHRGRLIAFPKCT